jgi:hypothetical protein
MHCIYGPASGKSITVSRVLHNVIANCRTNIYCVCMHVKHVKKRSWPKILRFYVSTIVWILRNRRAQDNPEKNTRRPAPR